MTAHLTAEQIAANETLVRMIDFLKRQAERAADLEVETQLDLINEIGQLANKLEILTTGEIE